MEFNWKVYEYDYQKRTRNLTSEAQGVVKSSKYFPVFQEEGQDTDSRREGPKGQTSDWQVRKGCS